MQIVYLFPWDYYGAIRTCILISTVAKRIMSIGMFYISWNEFESTPSCTFKDLLLDEDFTDVTLLSVMMSK